MAIERRFARSNAGNRAAPSARSASLTKEADGLTDGFTKFLDRVSSEQNLPPRVQLFIGSSFVLVNLPAKAIEPLKKVPKPADTKVLFPPKKDEQPAGTPEERDAAALYRIAVRNMGPRSIASCWRPMS